MFWYWLWLALTGCIMITNQITMARGDKRPSRALLEAIVANLIFAALLAWALLVSRYPSRISPQSTGARANSARPCGASRLLAHRNKLLSTKSKTAVVWRWYT